MTQMLSLDAHPEVVTPAAASANGAPPAPVFLAVDANAGAHGATSADGAITLLPVYCLGLCSTSPAVAFNDKVHARMDADKFDALVAAARSAS